MTTTASPTDRQNHVSPVPTPSTRWTRYIGPAVVLLIAGLAVGRFLTAGEHSSPPAPISAAAGGAPTNSLEALQARTVTSPDSAEAWLAYGTVAMRTAIATGDPSFYGAAEQALDTALRLAPKSSDTLAARAGLDLSLHEFAAALPLAQQAVEANPLNIIALAALFDARIENGDYAGAEITLKQLLNVNPGVAAYARVSYLRQLTGDMTGARTAMQQAVAAAGPGPERSAVENYLGDINLELGDFPAARSAYQRALGDLPTSVSASLGTARVMMADGRLAEAAALVAQVVTRSPQPAAATLQGELALMRNDPATVTSAFALVQANDQILRSQGIVTDLESAVFHADRGEAAPATESARAAYSARRTIFTADALAWALVASGRPAEAVPMIDEALAGGITSPSIHVHAAAAFAAIGDTSRASAELAIAFRSAPWLTPSIRPVAARLAGELGLSLPKEWS